MKLSGRTSRLSTAASFAVLGRAKALEAEGRRIVHLEIGEPDFDTPEHIVEAGVRALRDGHTHYTPAAGVPALRELIAAHISATRGVAVSPEQVIVTPGGKPVIFYTMLALVEDGDEVIVPSPAFPVFASVARYAGGSVVPIRLKAEDRFILDPQAVADAITPKTRVIVINSPSNPTGSVTPKSVLEAIADLLRDRPDIHVLSDEIYSRIRYDVPFHSILSEPGMADRTILLDGFSKTYAMTGWRLGYGIVPQALAEPFTRLQINSTSHANAATQQAGIAALEGPQTAVDDMVAEFRVRRDRIIAGLNGLPGVDCPLPDGAFYAFPNIEATGLDADALAERLLVEAGVALLPGTGFGEFGDGHLRISYANDLENIELALASMSEVLAVKA